jgi:tetratricopeptide (TPR) repeat protein
MASANQPEAAGRQPLTPATRRRLQQCFEHGSKSAAKGDFDYAADMFTQCVLGDPGNLIYVQQFLGNLYRKYNNNKKGSKLVALTGVGLKGGIKRASLSKDWQGLIKSGLDMLKLNPWDVSTLTALAVASEALGYDETQLAFLRSALDVNPKDADVNRQCALALSRMGQFDQAIACWHRVEQARPGDLEAQKAISDLAVNKTITRGGYDANDSTVGGVAQRAGRTEARPGTAQAAAGEPAEQLTREQQLQRQIARRPEELSAYLELADLHAREERFDQVESVLTQALAASGGDLSVRERLEDAQLRRGHQQLLVAENRARQEKTPETIDLARRMRAECNRVELEVYRGRCERYPTNLALRYEVGLRLKRAGQYNEAIQSFQLARGDVKRKAAVHLELGECFQQIKQYKLALSNYETSLESVTEREPELRKLALYRAGVLAQGLKDLGQAEKYLTELASLEFGYKDVPDRLDKIAQLRNSG